MRCAPAVSSGLSGVVIARPEDSGAQTDHVGAAVDGGHIIAAHAHGQKVHNYIIVFFFAIVNKKLMQQRKIWAIFFS